MKLDLKEAEEERAGRGRGREEKQEKGREYTKKLNQRGPSLTKKERSV